MSIGDLDGDSAIGGMRRGLGAGIIYSSIYLCVYLISSSLIFHAP